MRRKGVDYSSLSGKKRILASVAGGYAARGIFLLLEQLCVAFVEESNVHHAIAAAYQIRGGM